jgi:WD40 repeat protein
VRAIAFSPDGRTLASGVAWGNIRLWDIATGRERFPSEEPLGYVNHVRFASDGGGLVSISRDRRVLWWDLATQTPRRQFSWTAPGGIHAELSPDGNTLAVGTWVDLKARKWEVRLWDVRTGKPGRLLGKYQPGFWPIAFSPDGRLVASGGRDHVIPIWNVSDGKESHQIKDISDEVVSLCFSPDGTALACGTYPEGLVTAKPALRLWDLASGKERCLFDMHFSYVTGLAFSPDGKVIAAGDINRGEGCLVRLWDTATGRELCRHTGHREEVGAIAFSPDGKLVASGAGWFGQKDNSVHIWEAATGRLIHRFEGHHSCVGDVAFSPDGLTVASGAGDSTILLWDITGRRAGGTPALRTLVPRSAGVPPAQALTPRQLDACWSTLAHPDASKAYDAVWQLVAAPEQAIPFLRKHLPPVPRPDAKAVARWIADLDSEDFTVRQKATDELSKLGDTIAPALREALQGKSSLETRRRVQSLLDQSRDWTSERLRAHRAIQVLEHIGPKPARDALQALAEGAPEAFRTEEAKASLQRWQQR